MSKPGDVGPASMSDGKNFQELLVESLDKVNQLQLEAADGVEKIAAGTNNDLSEVFSTVRKADMAFSLLMEMHNKLLDAYRGLQQMQD
jgi:flagellar hook-basal body complex protein FliE